MSFDEFRFPYSMSNQDSHSDSYNDTFVSSYIPFVPSYNHNLDIPVLSVNPTPPTTLVHTNIAHSNPSILESSSHSSSSPIPIHSSDDLIIALPIEDNAHVPINTVTSTHPMVTRSKIEISKPKV